MLKKNIYIKCNNWRVAVRLSYIWDARFLKVKRAYIRTAIDSTKTDASTKDVGLYTDVRRIFLFRVKRPLSHGRLRKVSRRPNCLSHFHSCLSKSGTLMVDSIATQLCVETLVPTVRFTAIYSGWHLACSRECQSLLGL